MREIHQLVVKDAERDLSRIPGLRHIEREHVHYLNQISSTRAPLVFEWLSRSWRMTMQPISLPALTFAERALIDWGGAEVVLRLEHALVGAAMNSLLETQSVGALEGEIRNLVIDGAFVGLSEMIEERLRKRLRHGLMTWHWVFWQMLFAFGLFEPRVAPIGKVYQFHS